MISKTHEAFQRLWAKWERGASTRSPDRNLGPQMFIEAERRLAVIRSVLAAKDWYASALMGAEDRRMASLIGKADDALVGPIATASSMPAFLNALKAVEQALDDEMGLPSVSFADRSMSSAERRRDSLASLAKEAAGQAKSIQDMEREAKASLDVLDDLRGRAIAEDALLATRQQEVKEQIETLDHEAKSAQESLQKALDSLELVRKDARAEGLAKAFQRRSEKLQSERRIWARVFVVAIVVLFVVALVFTVELTDFTFQELTVNFLRRLGTIAPAVWLGWYAARQLGRISRVQEDYEFKAATALAYQSYRDEISALVNNEALKEKFAEVVIENFGNNPVRLYENTKHDDSVSPSEAMFKNLSPEQLAALCVDGLNRVQALLPKK